MLRYIFYVVVPMLLCAPLSLAEQELYAPQVPGAVAVRLGGPLIDEIALKDADISQAIELIAQKSGLNIITGQSVKGKVTIFLKRVAAREALRIVLESNGLAYAEEGGIIRVMPAGEFLDKYGYAFGQQKVSRLIKLNFIIPRDVEKLLEAMKSAQGRVAVNEEARTVLLVDSAEKVRAMEVFLAELDVPVTAVTIPLKNVRADTLVPEVRRLLTQSFGVVEADMGTNSLVVTDTVARVARVRKAVESMDARGRVMVLEAKLVHVVLNDQHPNGVDWAGIVEDHQRMRLPGKYSFLAAPDSGRALSFGMISNDDFPTLVEALDTVGLVQEYPLSTIRVSGDEQVRVVVRLDDPSLDMAVIVPGEEEDALPAGGAAMAFTVKAAFDVTGDVVTSVLPREAWLSAGDLPRGAHAVHASELSAREGYIAVIGGLIIAERISAAHKIPLLGDLPILGAAFRMEGAVRKEEFAVFLTPKSVSLSQILADEGPGNDATLIGEE